MAISPINALQTQNNISSGVSSVKQDNSFSDLLNQALNGVSDAMESNEAADNALLSGDADNIHSVMIAGEKADIELSLAIQVRNKVVDAYNEVMRMQI